MVVEGLQGHRETKAKLFKVANLALPTGKSCALSRIKNNLAQEAAGQSLEMIASAKFKATEMPWITIQRESKRQIIKQLVLNSNLVLVLNRYNCAI